MSLEDCSYDSFGEPNVTLRFSGGNDPPIPIRLVLDTGFNRSLFIYRVDAQMARLAPTTRFSSSVYLADGSPIHTMVTVGYVEWFGSVRQVEVMVMNDVPNEIARSRKSIPRGLIGMDLLRGLEIGFGREINIRRLEDA
jgi:predicted aspartyl protease